jgi:hypothetical protein
MFTFIAGQINNGHLRAMTTVLSRSSAIPLAILPIVLAVAGAITATSAPSAKEMCSTDGRVRSPHIVVRTGVPLSVAKVNGVTNCMAAWVMTALTLISALNQETHESRNLIRGDAAGYAQQY